MLKLVVLLVLLSQVRCDKQKEFLTKLHNLAVPFLTAEEMGKIADVVYKQIEEGKEGKEISRELAEQLNKHGPRRKIGALLKVTRAINTCLRKAHQRERASQVLKKMAPAFSEVLEPVHTEIQEALETMKSNGESVAARRDKVYSIGLEHLSESSIQELVTACKESVDAKEWDCIVKHGSTVVSLNKYST